MTQNYEKLLFWLLGWVPILDFTLTIENLEIRTTLVTQKNMETNKSTDQKQAKKPLLTLTLLIRFSLTFRLLPRKTKLPWKRHHSALPLLLSNSIWYSQFWPLQEFPKIYAKLKSFPCINIKIFQTFSARCFSPLVKIPSIILCTTSKC